MDRRTGGIGREMVRSASVRSPAPKRWMDAYLNACARLTGARLVTFDRGFRQSNPMVWIWSCLRAGQSENRYDLRNMDAATRVNDRNQRLRNERRETTVLRRAPARDAAGKIRSARARCHAAGRIGAQIALPNKLSLASAKNFHHKFHRSDRNEPFAFRCCMIRKGDAPSLPACYGRQNFFR